MDLWRLPEGKISQLVDLPQVFSECVSLIEWPDLLGAELTPEAYLDLELNIVDDTPPSAARADDSCVGDAPTPAKARTVGDSPPDGEADLEDFDEEDDFEQPRVATLTARGARWEALLRDL